MRQMKKAKGKKVMKIQKDSALMLFSKDLKAPPLLYRDEDRK